MKEITIKQATIEDLDILMKWRMEVLNHVFDIPKDKDTKDLYNANKEYYENTIEQEKHIAIFAKIDGKIVGCGGLCLYQEMPSPDNTSGKCAYLMNIYTKEKYRGYGVGKTVVKYLVNYAKKRGITKIYLETSISGRPLYESIGFQDAKDYMII